MKIDQTTKDRLESRKDDMGLPKSATMGDVITELIKSNDSIDLRTEDSLSAAIE